MARIASEIGAHSAEEHFCITHKDKVVLRTSLEFLPKINSIFYSSPEIIHPSPHPNPHWGRVEAKADVVQKGDVAISFVIYFEVKTLPFLNGASATK